MNNLLDTWSPKNIFLLKRHPDWLLLSIFLLAFFLRMYRLDAQSLWWDELSTVARATLTLPDLFANLLTVRNHMPFYFLLTRLWSVVGGGAFEMRFFSVVWAMVGIALIFNLGQLIGGRRVGLIAAFLLAISPFHIWYSQEARMYTMTAALSLAAHWFLLRAISHNQPRQWAGYGLAALTAVYTHYLTLFLLIAHYIFFSLHYRRAKPQFSRWLATSGIVIALAGVWIIIIALTGGFANAPISWIAPATLSEPILTLFVFALGSTSDPGQFVFYPAFLIFLGYISAAVWLLARKSSKPDTQDIFRVRLLLLWLLAPLLLLCIISFDWRIANQRSIYMDRYLIISLPAFLLLTAWGMNTVSKKVSWRGLIPVSLSIITAVTAVSLVNNYFNPNYARDDWRIAIQELTTRWQPDDVLLVDPGQLLPTGYYGNARFNYEVMPFLANEVERERHLTEEMPSRIAVIQNKTNRLWHIANAENTNPHGFPQDRNRQAEIGYGNNPYAVWLDQNYLPTIRLQFTGMRLTLYNLDTNRSQ